MSEETSLHDTLTEQIEDAPWSALQTHAMKGTLLILGDELNLVDAAVAIADDETAVVEQWIESAQLTKPDLDAVALYGSNPTDRFAFVIVQPYVLAKRILN